MTALKNNFIRLKNLHLIVCVIIVVPVALIYGLYPATVLPELFGFNVDTVNLISVFRAMMGLYISMCVAWVVGIIKPSFWYAATISNIVFMSGLAVGRLISVVADGIPSHYFLYGLIAELLFAVWGLRNIKKYGRS